MRHAAHAVSGIGQYQLQLQQAGLGQTQLSQITQLTQALANGPVVHAQPPSHNVTTSNSSASTGMVVDANEWINRLDELLSRHEPKQFVLGVTRADFCTTDIRGIQITPQYLSEDDINIETITSVKTSQKKYLNDCKEFYACLKALKKDVAALKEGKIPRAYLHKTNAQFKKSMQEKHEPLQKEADQAKAKLDFERKIQAAKEWIEHEAANLQPHHVIVTALGDVYDVHTNKRLPMQHDPLLKAKTFTQAYMANVINITEERTKKAYLDDAKAEADKSEKQQHEKQVFQKFLADYPQAAMAVFFREVESRLLAVMLAKREDMVTSYKKSRSGQNLTKLEEQVYELKEELEQKEMPSLKQKVSPFLDDALKRRARKKSEDTRQKTPSRSRSKSAPKSTEKKPKSSASRGRSTEKKSSSSTLTRNKVEKGTSQNRSTSAVSVSSAGTQRSRVSNKSKSSMASRSSQASKTPSRNRSTSSTKSKKGKGKGRGKAKGKGRRQSKP